MNIFLDIETIPSQEPWVREYIEKKTTPPANIKKQDSIDKWYEEKHAEAVGDAMAKCSFDGAMNHIICIGAAVGDEEPVSFYEALPENENVLLIEFYTWLQNVSSEFGRIFIGHNITGFDLRVIRQRSIIRGVRPPKGIPFDARPWDKNPYDTMSQFAGARDTISLDKLATALGVQGKSDIDGSMVYGMWKDGKHDEIAMYCKDDVRMVREVYNKMKIIS